MKSIKNPQKARGRNQKYCDEFENVVINANFLEAKNLQMAKNALENVSKSEEKYLTDFDTFAAQIFNQLPMVVMYPPGVETKTASSEKAQQPAQQPPQPDPDIAPKNVTP